MSDYREKRDSSGVLVCSCSTEPYRVHEELPAEPGRFAYFDDERETLDRVNWAVVEAEVSAAMVNREMPDVVPMIGTLDDLDDDEPLPAAFIGDDYTPFYCRGRLHTRPDTRADHEAERLARSLADYYTLDEEAMSEAEFDAWCSWWDADGFDDLCRGLDGSAVIDLDVWRAAVGSLADVRARARANERLAEILDDEEADGFDVVEAVCGFARRDDVSCAVQSAMGYYNGWTGEYDESGAVDGLRSFVTASLVSEVVEPLREWQTCRGQLTLV